jgi:hypothetical protein
VFPAGKSFQAHIAQYVIDFQETCGFGPIRLTTDKEFTLAEPLHQWHEQAHPIEQYGPRANMPSEGLGIFTEAIWRGLAMAKLQLGLAILLANAIKWHKIKTGQLQPLVLKATA